MPRWAWFLPVGALTVAGALLGYRYGWIAANLTETDAIEAYAARYMDDTGAGAANCTARPGRQVWLVIRCGSGEDRRIYRVNRFGGLVEERRGPGARLEEPNT